MSYADEITTSQYTVHPTMKSEPLMSLSTPFLRFASAMLFSLLLLLPLTANAWREQRETDEGVIMNLWFQPVPPTCVPNGEGELCDTHSRCHEWRKEGECTKSEEYMREHCPVSCPAKDGCIDTNLKCEKWADHGECVDNEHYMHLHCPVSCGLCDEETGQRKVAKSYDESDVERLATLSELFGVRQVVEGVQKDQVLEVIEGSVDYMKKHVGSLPGEIIQHCENRHELCSFWVVVDECVENEAYMSTNCAPACKSCELIDFETRCPVLENPKTALLPGDLNKLFERIVATAPGNRTLTDDERSQLTEIYMPEYTVSVYSRPESAQEISIEADGNMDPGEQLSKEQDQASPPWVLVFDNFVTDEECDGLIQLGYKHEYKRSEDVGEATFDGSYGSVKSEKRTSENAWCTRPSGCRAEETPKRIHDRIAHVLGIDAVNSEDLQILKYEKGQFYKTHHDYIPNQKERQCGPRILTFFLYLSDVEDGGGTDFPLLDVTVQPKKGRAVLWPSVLNSDPFAPDSRMNHQALEVLEGVKYAANGWIHMHDYITPQAKGCD